MEKQRHARSKTTAQYPRQIKPHTPRSEQESGKCRRIVVVADNLFVVGLIVLLVGGLGWVGRLCLLLFFVFVCCLFFLGGGGATSSDAAPFCKATTAGRYPGIPNGGQS